MNRSELAKQHVLEMEQKWHSQITTSINGSEIHNMDYMPNPFDVKKNVIVDAITTQEAIIKYTPDCVLNFASFKYPGGGFLSGSMAQEEALCHCSTLYNVLKEFSSEYSNNRSMISSGIVDSTYKNWAIFSPDIIFEVNEKFITTNVITCPAPNLNGNIKDETNVDSAIYERVRYVLHVAKQHNCKKIILGAFGCGVFGNNPYTIATMFKKVLLRYNEDDFSKIIFAIPDIESKNFKEFNTVFNML